MSNKQVIMYHSAEAASRQTVTGWVSSHNHFWGEDEHMARYEGSTHQVCECGNIHSNSYTRCEACRDKAETARYLGMPVKEWDETVPVFSNKHNEYFFEAEALQDYIRDNDIEPEELHLLICEEEYAPTIDGDDYYHDMLPDDQSLEEVAPELAKLLYDLNDFILKNKPVLSWKPGRFRAVLPGPSRE